MKFTPDEQLSAFLDGELPEMETELVVRRSLKDDGLKRTAIRYCVIGDVMRDELPPGGPVDLVSRVHAQLEGEPEPVASPGKSRAWPRLAAGMAVAASVALVAVLAIPGGSDRPEPAPLSASQVAAPAAGPAYIVPPARQASAGPDRLTRYYINHSEYSRLMGGRSALSRIVVSTPDMAADGGPVRIEKVNAPR